MDAKQQARAQRKQELLKELAEIAVAEQREAGVFASTPHYSVLELAAHELGGQVSRLTQARGAREVAAEQPPQACCPGCGAPAAVRLKTRRVASIDGPVELSETVCCCRHCRRSFFPSTHGVGAR